jgi:hypothetical protein
MNADSVNRWLILGANTGVLVGLALLIVELDQNSDLVRAQIHQARSDNFESFKVELADTEYLLPTIAKFRAGGGPADVSALEELDPIELARLRQYYDGRIGGYDNLHYQYKQGFLDEDFYNARVLGPVKFLLPVWEELGLVRLGAENPHVTKSFAAEIERALADD